MLTRTARHGWFGSTRRTDGFRSGWPSSSIVRPPLRTKESAEKYVAEHMDDEDTVFKLPGNSGYQEIKAHEDDDLGHVFAALAGRKATDEERGDGLWSHCVEMAS
jgi:predicted metal-dependent phosphoesterase TrpH